MTAWREGLTNLTERGSGTVLFAWELEGGAGCSYYVQAGRGKALSVDGVLVWINYSCFLV